MGYLDDNIKKRKLANIDPIDAEIERLAKENGFYEEDFDEKENQQEAKKHADNYKANEEKPGFFEGLWGAISEAGKEERKKSSEAAVKTVHAIPDLMEGLAHGGVKTIDNTVNTIPNFIDWAEEMSKEAGLTDTNFIDDKEQWSNMADSLFGPQDTDAGRIGSAVGQYLLPYAAMAKVGKIRGWGDGKTLLNYALLDTAIIDPDSERLSDMLVKFPAARNFVTEYLASDESDSAWESRWKTFLESGLFGGGLYLLGKTLQAAVSLTKKARKYKAINDAPPPSEPPKGGDAPPPSDGGAAPVKAEQPNLDAPVKAEQPNLDAPIQVDEGVALDKVTDDHLKQLTNSKNEIDARIKKLEEEGVSRRNIESDQKLQNLIQVHRELRGAAKQSFKPKKNVVYQGRGATKEQIYGHRQVAKGTATPIFGKGQYYAFDPIAASKYGSVKEFPLPQLQNPLVLKTDSDLHKVMDEAGANLTDFGSMTGEEVKETINKLRGHIEANGHDGIVVNMSKDDKSKLLKRLLSDDQMVVFPSKAKQSVKPTAQQVDEAIALDKQITEQFPKGLDEQASEIANAESVKEIAEKLGVRGADFEAPISEQARRGVITHEQSIQEGVDILKSKKKVKKLLTSPPGTAYTSGEAAALKLLLANNHIKMKEILGAANTFQELSVVQKAAAIQLHDNMMFLSTKIQAAGAESARATNFFGVPYDKILKNANAAQKMQLVFEYAKTGGKTAEETFGVLKNIDQLGEKQLEKAYAKAVERKSNHPVQQMLYEIWINGVIGPGSWKKNTLGNTVLGGLSTAEKGTAAGIGALRSGFNRVVLGRKNTEVGTTVAEVFDYVDGAWQSKGEAFSTGWDTFKSEKAPEGFLDKIPGMQERTLTGPNIAELVGLPKDGKLSKVLTPITATMTSMTRGLKAQDVVFKVAHYRAAIKEEVNKAARIQFGLERGTPAYQNKVKELLDDVPPEIMDKAIARAEEMSLTTSMVKYDGKGKVIGANLVGGKLTNRMIENVREWSEDWRIPLVGKLLTSFGNISLNVADTIIQRTPVAAFSPRFRELLKTDPDLALARVALGSTAIGTFYHHAIEGNIEITGRREDYRQEKALKGAVQPECSLKAYDSYYKLDKDNPVGAMMCIAADIADLQRHVPENSDAGLYILQVGGMILGDMLVPDFLEDTMREFSDVISSSSGKDFNKNISNFMKSAASGFQPLAATQRDIKRAFYEERGFVDTTGEPGLWKTWSQIRNKFIADSLLTDNGKMIKLRNVWGEVVESPPGIGFDHNSPILSALGIAGLNLIGGQRVGIVSKDPVDREIERLRMADPLLDAPVEEGEKHMRLYMPSRFIRSSKSGVNFVHELTPKENDMYILLAAGRGKEVLELYGEGLSTKQKGALNKMIPLKDRIRHEVVNGYPSLGKKLQTDEAKKMLIMDFVNGYRQKASQAMIWLNTDIRQEFYNSAEARKKKVFTNPNEVNNLKPIPDLGEGE